jgi:hypothetical protein
MSAALHRLLVISAAPPRSLQLQVCDPWSSNHRCTWNRRGHPNKHPLSLLWNCTRNRVVVVAYKDLGRWSLSYSASMRPCSYRYFRFLMILIYVFDHRSMEPWKVFNLSPTDLWSLGLYLLLHRCCCKICRRRLLLLVFISRSHMWRWSSRPSSAFHDWTALLGLPEHILSIWFVDSADHCSLLDASSDHPGNLFSTLLITSAIKSSSLGMCIFCGSIVTRWILTRQLAILSSLLLEPYKRQFMLQLGFF